MPILAESRPAAIEQQMHEVDMSPHTQWSACVPAMFDEQFCGRLMDETADYRTVYSFHARASAAAEVRLRNWPTVSISPSKDSGLPTLD